MKKNIILFKNDLRIKDNPAVYEGSVEAEILPIYIFDDAESNIKRGSASKYWLHHSLDNLNKELNNNLLFLEGNFEEALNKLTEKYNIDGIYWNRSYDVHSIERDKKLKTHFESKGVTTKSFNASLLFEPWTITQPKTNMPYRVFTAFYNQCVNTQTPRKLFPSTENIEFLNHSEKSNINDLNLIDENNWHEKLSQIWNITEDDAHQKLENFLEDKINNYKNGRDFPALENTSYLSPYLHFGQISPHQIWWETHKTMASDEDNKDKNFFLRELIWREFSYHLLYHFPDITHKNIQKKFDSFPWSKNDAFLEKWQKGLTGYPIVDAGMRELWQTGYMHNRVRMITASFLIKNLMIHWQEGHNWFWDCLLDADIANNGASWQWVAGSGFDAAPYFRVFNPTTQAQKFDPDGEYIKKYIPELKKIPLKNLFEPWKTPDNILRGFNIKLGKDYPYPIVDLKESREKTLNAFNTLKQKNVT